MLLLDLLLAAVALIGHFAMWIGLSNRLHATALPCGSIRFLSKLIDVIVILIPGGFVWWYAIISSSSGTRPILLSTNNWFPLLYLLPCWAIALGIVPPWIWKRSRSRQAPHLLSNHTASIDVVEQLGNRPIGHSHAALYAWIPLNQIFRLAVNEKVLHLPRLHESLDRLTIAHISDFHFTGQITKPFFKEVVRQTNELDADLVAITGDIVDFERCVDWIPEILGELKSRYGIYYVLGNHDTRISDTKKLLEILNQSGLIHLGGRWIEVQLKDQPVVMAGNELPWFAPAPTMDDCPARDEQDQPLRILLSHTPDQIDWARRFDFDLMLAGHTHGGQVCLPIVGPIISPSRHGVKYASGLFYESPTLMHVSRGISGLHPIRINCLPEVTKLVLSAND